MSINNDNSFEQLSALEWIEANGVGGYASSTIFGTNTRRYHGLLIASLQPPVERHVLLNKLDDTLIVGDTRYALSANQYPGAVYPEGFQYLKKFSRDLFPVFVYEAGGVKIQKTITCIHGENTTVILYEVLDAKTDFDLILQPLCSYRDIHSLNHASDYIYKGYIFEDGVFRTKNYQNCAEVCIAVPGADFKPVPEWYYNFEYLEDLRRGEAFREDLFSHGTFSFHFGKKKKLGIIVSADDPAGKDAFKLFQKEKTRREALIKNNEGDENVKKLLLAADQFIVKRGSKLKSIIAGYHWFTDWGRDTMISLTGSCLITNRFDDAKKILKAFAENVSEGMLPNRFTDHGETPEYNTVDATLWFFYAIFQYHRYTGDVAFVKSMLPALKKIIDHYTKGTRYNIHADHDDLLYAGEDGVQLTWMDAKVDDFVVTPRRGKAVEVNAVWYNALAITATLMNKVSDDVESANLYRERADRVKNSFNVLFWNEEKDCLYDFVDGDYKNDDVRPNQIYAISLPFKLLEASRAEKVLHVVEQKLLTPRGLRSLSSDHAQYQPRYHGDRWQRDNAYHQGTVWCYLLGAYIDALVDIRKAQGQKEAAALLGNLWPHFQEAGVGTISEIFDGAPPHQARGCIAQAWSVAEMLRVSVEYKLFQK